MATIPGSTLSEDGKSVKVDAVALVAATAKCYGCQPATKEVRKQRALCVQRQAHNPRGPIIPHSHVLQSMRMCADCRTLVVG